MAHQSIAGMPAEQITWAPEGKWSAALIWEHLSIAFSYTVKGGRTLLRQRHPAFQTPTWRQRLKVAITVEARFFGRTQAPRFVTPRGAPWEQVRASLFENTIALDGVLHECEQAFGSRTCVLVHPRLGPLTVRQWRRFHWAHTRHHMRQIANVRRMFGHYA
jgi:hypothetical protein